MYAGHILSCPGVVTSWATALEAKARMRRGVPCSNKQTGGGSLPVGLHPRRRYPDPSPRTQGWSNYVFGDCQHGPLLLGVEFWQLDLLFGAVFSQALLAVGRPCWPWAGLKGMGSRRASGFSTGKAKVLSYGFSSSSHRLLRATAHREGTAKSMFAMLQPRSSLILAHPRLCDGPAKYCGRASFRTARQ